MGENSIQEFSTDIYSDEYTQQDFERDIQYSNARNVVVNKFKNFATVIEYKRPFFINDGSSSDLHLKVDRSRKFKYDCNDELQIAKEGVTFDDLIQNMGRSRRRSLDGFFGYALSNTWRYFITITFDPKKIDRHSRDDINYAWQLLRQKLQYRNKDIHILIVTEEHHTDGCLHFHGLIGHCDLTKSLTLGINNKKYLYDYNPFTREKVFQQDADGNYIPNKYYGCLVKTEFGDQVYNFDKDIFNLGFTTIVELHSDGVSGDNDRVSSYLMKYMSKDYNSCGYNKRSYFRTLNLDFKEKFVLKSKELFDELNARELIVSDKYLAKENDKYKIYRIPIAEFDNVDSLYQNVSSTNISKEDYIKSVVSGEKEYDKIYKPIVFGSRESQKIDMIFPTNDVLDIFE